MSVQKKMQFLTYAVIDEQMPWWIDIIILQEFFTKEHTRIPEVEGVLWLREGKKTWQKHYFVLRASGVYYTPKGKTKVYKYLFQIALKMPECPIWYL